MPTRRTLLAASGAVLLHAATGEGITGPIARQASEHGRLTPDLLDAVEHAATTARHLDERHGGGAALTWVGDQITTLLHLLDTTSYDLHQARRLHTALAQLAQTAGFMAHDDAHDGPARRWYLIAHRAAHAAQDHALAASVLALMSNQATARGDHPTALALAQAADRAARTAPGLVRALVRARGGLAHAAAGDTHAALTAHEQAHALLEADEPAPDWADYVDDVEIDAIAGRGLVALGRTHRPDTATLLARAVPLLSPRAYTDDHDVHQRSALCHGAWLGLAHARASEPEQAAEEVRRALRRLPEVHSTRTLGLLAALRTQLVATPTPQVNKAVQELDRHLA
ncbi:MULTISPECIES: hypothetical protein [Actinosynnema]|uniref:hypothetical protein n=1 Tax=Actinosynnema TaxID=40566 RepID=UPI0020A5AA90|nr:hypothetical protein [Actinosynnema pretiosum]MCP2097277.1 hypothetical protein [Actinosynnema pretiosum]